MQTIQLVPVEDQSFTITLDGSRYTIRIFYIGTTMAADISRNEIVLTTGQRITSGEMLIPFGSLQGLNGNFLLLTLNEELPDFNQFGLTQTLMYASYDELFAIVNGA